MKIYFRALLVLLAITATSRDAFAFTEQELIDGARKEGSLTVESNTLAYTGLLLKGFEKKYPFLKVNHVMFSAAKTNFSDQFLSRLPENRADVMTRCQDRGVEYMADGGWFASLKDLPHWADHPKNAEDDDRYVYFLGAPHVLIYNPALVEERDLPKSLAELLLPKWKGKVVLRDPMMGNSGAFLSYYVSANEKGGLEWYHSLGENKVTVAPGYWEVHELVETGKKQIGLSRNIEVLTFQRDYQRLTGKKSKLKYALLEGDLPYQYQLATVSARAPHPFAAKLFADYVISPEGGVALLAKEGFSVGKQEADEKLRKNTWELHLKPARPEFFYATTVRSALREVREGGATMLPPSDPKNIYNRNLRVSD